MYYIQYTAAYNLKGESNVDMASLKCKQFGRQDRFWCFIKNVLKAQIPPY